MAAWLGAMVRPNAAFHALKLDMAQDWWIVGLAFYLRVGAGGDLAALTERDGRGARHRGRRIDADPAAAARDADPSDDAPHPVELPTVGDVVAACLRLVAPALVVIVVARRPHGRALGVMDAGGMGAA